MKDFRLVFLSLFILIRPGLTQNILIGHLKHAEKPVHQVSIEIIPEKGSPFHQFTSDKSDFQITLPFQNTYTIKFLHPEYHTTYIWVNTNIPEDKKNYRMITEFEVLLYSKNDEDINKEIFNEPSQKFQFNGVNKIVNDTAWLRNFHARLIRTNVLHQIEYNPDAAKIPVNVCAKFFLENMNNIPLVLEEVQLVNKQNQIIKKTRTNRFGQLVITGIYADQLHEIKLFTNKNQTGGKDIYIRNNDSTFLKKTIPDQEGIYVWKLTSEDWKKLLCHQPEYYIGGKLVLTTKNNKDFYSEKNVYLCNQFNTVVKTTKTNRLGMFAFEDVKPDQTYFIGVDTNGIQKTDRLDLLNKEDRFVGRIDSFAGKRYIHRILTDGNDKHQMLLLSEKDLRMDINAKIYQKTPGQPLDAKVTVMNDKYKAIDSVRVNTLGEFTFKYLPFIKRFYLEFEPENDAMLDQLSQLLLYGKEGEFIKAFTNLKGKKFVYKPIAPEISKIRDVSMEDPWLELSLGNNQMSSGQNKNPVITEKILFEFNKYTIQESSEDILDKIAFVLKENTSYRLIISAFTDCIGNAKDNLELSIKRAEAVKQYLIQKGVQASRMQTKGYGEAQPLNHCVDGVNCSEMEHAVNRRVEFTIITNK